MQKKNTVAKDFTKVILSKLHTGFFHTSIIFQEETFKIYLK